MNHALTIGRLMLSIGASFGIAMLAIGTWELRTAGPSAAGSVIKKNSRIAIICGAAVAVACLLGLFA